MTLWAVFSMFLKYYRLLVISWFSSPQYTVSHRCEIVRILVLATPLVILGLKYSFKHTLLVFSYSWANGFCSSFTQLAMWKTRRIPCCLWNIFQHEVNHASNTELAYRRRGLAAPSWFVQFESHSLCWHSKKSWFPTKTKCPMCS